MPQQLRVLVITKGHPFQREPFFQVFDDNHEIVWTHVEQPAALVFLHPDRARDFDAYVLYDMPGVVFRPGEPPSLPSPPAELVEGMTALLDAGHGMVFLHHALAGWPGWPEYAEIVGGRFHYRPATLQGQEWPDSGYRLDVEHHVSVAAPGHPVVEGLEDGFDLLDELYLAPVLEDDVVPLMRSDYTFIAENFHSAALALQGRMNSNDGWEHPSGSNLVAWAKRSGRSPIVYLQPGDGPSAYGNDGFRRLLANAIRWVASDDARAWAAGGPDAVRS